MILKHNISSILLIGISWAEETITYGAYIVKRAVEIVYFKQGKDGNKHRVTKEEYDKNTKDALPFFFTLKR